MDCFCTFLKFRKDKFIGSIGTISELVYNVNLLYIVKSKHFMEMCLKLKLVRRHTHIAG